jgi:hypothetical protein
MLIYGRENVTSQTMQLAEILNKAASLNEIVDTTAQAQPSGGVPIVAETAVFACMHMANFILDTSSRDGARYLETLSGLMLRLPDEVAEALLQDFTPLFYQLLHRHVLSMYTRISVMPQTDMARLHIFCAPLKVVYGFLNAGGPRYLHQSASKLSPPCGSYSKHPSEVTTYIKKYSPSVGLSSINYRNLPSLTCS